MKNRNILIVLFTSLFLVFVLASSVLANPSFNGVVNAPDLMLQQQTSVTPIQGGTITEAVGTDAVSFHPYVTTDNTSKTYQFRVYASGLWQRDPQTNLPIPYMAESWTLSNDGTTFTFNLRQDMMWSDGTPITAQDFVWTFNQANNPDNNYPYISIFNDIESYTAEDDYTLEVTLKNPTCAGILTAGQITPLPMHIWQDLPWSDPENNPEILTPSVVSGPWRLQEWRRDEYAIFSPNQSYFDSVPVIDMLVTRIVPDPAVQLQLLTSGEIDFAPVSAAGYGEARQASNLSYYEWSPAQAVWYFIGFNFRRPLLQEDAIRHALSYAMPRESIAEVVFNGLAAPTHSTYSPSNWVYNPDVPMYDFDIDEANNVLNEAGYVLNADGRRLDADGNPIQLTIYYPTGDGQRELIALIAQEQFGELGIEVEVVTLESQALFEYLQNSADEWDMWVGLARDTSDPHFMYQAWSEATIPAINIGAYINPRVEELYAQGNQTPCDIDSRRVVYQEIQQHISEDSAYIFLVALRGYAFVNNRIVVNPVEPLGVNYRMNEWSVGQ